jgi:nickel transport protein
MPVGEVQGWILGLWTPPASAHGVEITYRSKQVIELEARYSSGNPLVNAQVSVYSPADPVTAWQKGVTDPQGLFSFTPDPSQAGFWEVTVRQAGHGGVVTIPIQSSPVQSSPAQSTLLDPAPIWKDPLEKGVLVASLLWGCVGTALFFSRSKNT